MYDDREANEPTLPGELAALERQLAGLAPAMPRVDRDRLMFAAGAASAQPERLGYIAEPSWLGVRFWPAATAAMTAATIVLSAMLVWQRVDTEHWAAKPQAVDDVVVAVDAEPRDTRRDAWRWPDRIPSGYLGLRYVALTRGDGAFDHDSPIANGGESEPSPPATARQLMDELLPAPKHPSS